MSIILKALKQADASKQGKTSRFKVFSALDRKSLGIFTASIFTAALAMFFVFYLIHDKSRPSGLKSKIPPAKTTAPSPAAQAPDISKIKDNAAKLIMEGKYKEAEAALIGALSIKPDEPSLYNHLGIALKRQSRYTDAVSAYEKALKLKPDFTEAMNNLAVAFEAVGKEKEAGELYKKALSINPSYAEAHINYALFLEKNGRASDAGSHYRLFLKLSKDEGLKTEVMKKLKDPKQL